MSLAEARARAKGIQAEFALGSPHKVARPTLKFEDARRMFLADSEKRNKPRTVEEYTCSSKFDLVTSYNQQAL